MKTIAVLFGGRSPEYEVSLVSATYVIQLCRALPDYEVLPVGIDRKGMFFEYQGDVACIKDDRWIQDRAHLCPILFQPGSLPGYRRLRPDGTLEEVAPDLVFPVLHGADGEGGPLQGFLESLQVPYVGCRYLSAALMMDKVFANHIFEQAGLDQTPYVSFTANDFVAEPQLPHALIADQGISYPVFVKPANAGSSVGISKVRSADQLSAAIQAAAAVDTKILIEEGVVGRELEVAVLEKTDGSLLISQPGEIIPGSDFYDYRDKYAADSKSQLAIPASLDDAVCEHIQTVAGKAFRAGDCHGLARVDFFLRQVDGKILINEINTMPGFTPISMYPKLILQTGMSEEEMIRTLLASAFS